MDRRIDLIIAYTEAGLTDKADALKAEMVAEKLGHSPRGLADIKADLDKFSLTLDKLSDAFGVPRRKRRPK